MKIFRRRAKNRCRVTALNKPLVKPLSRYFSLIFSASDHHVIRHKMFAKLDNLMQSLGDIPPHGPLLLTWSLLHQLLVTSQQDGVGSVGVVKRCGNASLQLKVFQYLSACLSMEPFSGNTVSRLNDTLMPLSKVCNSGSYLVHRCVLDAWESVPHSCLRTCVFSSLYFR